MPNKSDLEHDNVYEEFDSREAAIDKAMEAFLLDGNLQVGYNHVVTLNLGNIIMNHEDLYEKIREYVADAFTRSDWGTFRKVRPDYN